MRPHWLLAVIVVASPLAVHAQTPIESARQLVARYHHDPTALDRARDGLEAALTRERAVDTLIMASYVQFLWADVRGQSDEVVTAKVVAGIVNRLREQGVPHRVVEFDGGHEIDARILASLG